MATNTREIRARQYDPNYDTRETWSEYHKKNVTYQETYDDIKESNDDDVRLQNRPAPTPHHIRGIAEYSQPFLHLTPENQNLIRKELRPYGLFFGNDSENLVHAEGRFSRSVPGRTRTVGVGSEHHRLHERSKQALKSLNLDRKGWEYTGVAGVPWEDMSQEQIMAFLRAMAVKDEMTMNQTLSYAVPLPPAIQQVADRVKQKHFPNRLTGTADTLDIMFQAQGSSLEEAAERSTETFQAREAGAEVARKEGGLFGMPDLGITETLAGFSLIGGERQRVMKRHLL